jgi:alpha-beta hydrolase superfamily lysophospholipase
MKTEKIKIKNIPAILWGEPSEKLFITVHGDKSSKEDEVIRVLAEEATAAGKGYQVLSFDLPEHGDRKNQDVPCKVQNCVNDIEEIIAYAQSVSKRISIFGCSMGAYFSLLAFRNIPLEQCLFLSPVVDMERLIRNMMVWFGVTEERLEREKENETPIGKTLYWDYFCYVKEHPIDKWDTPTGILYGSDDNITENSVIKAFSERFGCNLQVLEHGEHFFHTETPLAVYRNWLKENII